MRLVDILVFVPTSHAGDMSEFLLPVMDYIDLLLLLDLLGRTRVDKTNITLAGWFQVPLS